MRGSERDGGATDAKDKRGGSDILRDLLSETFVESYRSVADRTTTAHELNAQLTQQFFNAVVENLCGQSENVQGASRDLAEQIQ